jgi:hypothetical protein
VEGLPNEPQHQLDHAYLDNSFERIQQTPAIAIKHSCVFCLVCVKVLPYRQNLLGPETRDVEDAPRTVFLNGGGIVRTKHRNPQRRRCVPRCCPVRTFELCNNYRRPADNSFITSYTFTCTYLIRYALQSLVDCEASMHGCTHIWIKTSTQSRSMLKPRFSSAYVNFYLVYSALRQVSIGADPETCYTYQNIRYAMSYMYRCVAAHK